MQNQAAAILAAWQSIEILTPRTFKHTREFTSSRYDKIINIDKEPLPWHRTRKPLQVGERYCYQLVFGTLKLSSIQNKLLNTFAEQQPVNPLADKKAAIAAISIDANGQLYAADQIAISSFAWAYPLVLKYQFDEITNWRQHENQLKIELYKCFTIVDSKNHTGSCEQHDKHKSLTKQSIELAYKLFIQKLEIDPDDLEQTYFLIEKVVKESFDIPPSLPLLNSFFINDLNKIADQTANNAISRALQCYLQIKHVSHYTDVMTDSVYLENLLTPFNMPLGRWPTSDNSSLVLLQQAIVNAVCHKDDHHDLLAVNGPPGTGKTTIIRDIIADLIIKRAEVMIGFNDPEEAFTYKHDVRVFGNDQEFYTIDSKLIGFEALIASANNNAVENISKELMHIDTIASDISILNYFKDTSDAIYAAHSTSNNEQSASDIFTDQDIYSPTWGLLAAVLGNKSNVNKFRYAFWGHKHTSVKSYLETAMGLATESTEKPRNDQHRSEFGYDPHPHPPQNKAEALDKWQQAVKTFQQATFTVREQLDILENARQYLKLMDDHEKEHQYLLQLFASLSDDIYVTQQREVDAHNAVREQVLKAAAATTRLYKQKIHQPPFWYRFIKRSDWKQWYAEFQQLKQDDQQITLESEEFAAQHQALVSELTKLNGMIDSLEDNIIDSAYQKNVFHDCITCAQAIARGHFADEALWSQEYQELHKTTLWLSAEIQRSRDVVFTAAMAVHKAFIGAAAIPLYSNLTILMGLLGHSWSIQLDPDELADLWRNLFLITPIVSTTFASVEYMFHNLPSESFGWLIVDEAGQSVPQAVVGTMQRCRRAVILGDPIQLEPIYELPGKLLDSLCHVYDINHQKWSPAHMSVQSCADAASELGTYRGSSHKPQWVGLPLLVHRRCDDPMFSIANDIAYDNAMIHATAKRPSPIRDIIGNSCWLNINGYSDDKWSDNEGDCVIRIIRTLLMVGNDKPDIFIVTPFKNIKMRMHSLFKQDIARPHGFTDAQTNWFTNRIGTVHTFQGKEAEAVIFLLGAPALSESKSRAWASSSPNLMNVAVTRAKNVLYVVGNHQAWRQHGVFHTLASKLPVFEAKDFY